MARRYDMATREAQGRATRQAILDAAHGLLNRSDGGTLALGEIAAAAGVSRATIYNRIGSRAELLAAVFEDQGRLIGYGTVLEAMHRPDPVEAALATVEQSCRAWAVMPVAIRRTLALAVLDDEVGQLVTRYEGYRRTELARLAHRLVRGRVRREEMTDRLTLLTSFPAYDLLRATHGHEGATSTLLGMMSRALDITPSTT